MSLDIVYQTFTLSDRPAGAGTPARIPYIEFDAVTGESQAVIFKVVPTDPTKQRLGPSLIKCGSNDIKLFDGQLPVVYMDWGQDMELARGIGPEWNQPNAENPLHFGAYFRRPMNGSEISLLGAIGIPGDGLIDIIFEQVVVMGEQTVNQGTITLVSPGDGASLRAQQTFPGWNGYLTDFEYTIDTPPNVDMQPAFPVLNIYAVSDTLYHTSLRNFNELPSTVGTHRVEFASPLAVTEQDYAAVLTFASQTHDHSVGFAGANGQYAAGALTMLAGRGSGPVAGDDLMFKVYGYTL